MKKYFLTAAAALAMVAGVMVNAANAATISVGWSVDGGAITTVPGSGVTDVFSTGAVNTGLFNFIFASDGTTQPTLPSPGLLLSRTVAVTAAGGASGHDLDVYVTAQGLTDPLGNPLGILSGFTQNILQGFTTELATLIDSANGLFSGTALSSATFLVPGSSVQLGLGNTGAGPYSITAHYHFEAVANTGFANATIDAVAVPGPLVGAGLPGLVLACGGLIGLARRRRKQQQI